MSFDAVSQPFIAIGMLFRRTRRAAQLSLSEMSRALGYSPTYLSDVEFGRRAATRDLCDELSRVMGLDRTELYARAGHLSDAVLGYLQQTPRALQVLELLAERQASPSDVQELCEAIQAKACAEASGSRRGGESLDPDQDLAGSRKPEASVPPKGDAARGT